jgi:hypothetical protein
MNWMKKLMCVMVVIATFCSDAVGQSKIKSLPDHDAELYYFGIALGINRSAYKLSYTPQYAAQDDFSMVQPINGPGFTMGIIGNLKLSNFVTLRFIPALTFANKSIQTVGKLPENTAVRNVESIFTSLPLQLKFKSDRIHNFRFYGIVGSKFDYDLASNAKSRRDDEWLKIKPYDVGAEVGIGFEFYFPNFILSPELKFSHGLMDLHEKDKLIPLSNQIDRINTRCIMLTLMIEG